MGPALAAAIWRQLQRELAHLGQLPSDDAGLGARQCVAAARHTRIESSLLRLQGKREARQEAVGGVALELERDR